MRPRSSSPPDPTRLDPTSRGHLVVFLAGGIASDSDVPKDWCKFGPPALLHPTTSRQARLHERIATVVSDHSNWASIESSLATHVSSREQCMFNLNVSFSGPRLCLLCREFRRHLHLVGQTCGGSHRFLPLVHNFFCLLSTPSPGKKSSAAV